MTYKKYCKEFPIRQSFHTGRYGFRRVHGCIDLNSCTHHSRQAAGRARKQAWEDHLAEEAERDRLMAIARAEGF